MLEGVLLVSDAKFRIIGFMKQLKSLLIYWMRSMERDGRVSDKTDVN